MFGFVEGWYEPEYNPTTARSWRWMSEQRALWVRPVGRDVTLRITGESPLRYFDGRAGGPGPRRRRRGRSIRAGRRFLPAITVPAQALAAADGMVTVESSLWFTPAQRGESADQRHLALRIYSVGVR